MPGIDLHGGEAIEVIISTIKVQIIGYGLFLVGANPGIIIITDILETFASERSGGKLISRH
jgi:hypothetical protein